MDNELTEIETDQADKLPEKNPSEKALGVLPLDVTKYLNQMDGFDMTDEQKKELLEILWSIMSAFVDLGFGIDAVQYIFRDTDSNSIDSKEDKTDEATSSHRFNRIAFEKEKQEDCP